MSGQLSYTPTGVWTDVPGGSSELFQDPFFARLVEEGPPADIAVFSKRRKSWIPSFKQRKPQPPAKPVIADATKEKKQRKKLPVQNKKQALCINDQPAAAVIDQEADAREARMKSSQIERHIRSVIERVRLSGIYDTESKPAIKVSDETDLQNEEDSEDQRMAAVFLEQADADAERMRLTDLLTQFSTQHYFEKQGRAVDREMTFKQKFVEEKCLIPVEFNDCFIYGDKRLPRAFRLWHSYEKGLLLPVRVFSNGKGEKFSGLMIHDYASSFLDTEDKRTPTTTRVEHKYPLRDFYGYPSHPDEESRPTVAKRILYSCTDICSFASLAVTCKTYYRLAGGVLKKPGSSVVGRMTATVNGALSDPRSLDCFLDDTTLVLSAICHLFGSFIRSKLFVDEHIMHRLLLLFLTPEKYDTLWTQDRLVQLRSLMDGRFKNRQLAKLDCSFVVESDEKSMIAAMSYYVKSLLEVITARTSAETPSPTILTSQHTTIVKTFAEAVVSRIQLGSRTKKKTKQAKKSPNPQKNFKSEMVITTHGALQLSYQTKKGNRGFFYARNVDSLKVSCVDVEGKKYYSDKAARGDGRDSFVMGLVRLSVLGTGSQELTYIQDTEASDFELAAARRLVKEPATKRTTDPYASESSRESLVSSQDSPSSGDLDFSHISFLKSSPTKLGKRKEFPVLSGDDDKENRTNENSVGRKRIKT